MSCKKCGTQDPDATTSTCSATDRMICADCGDILSANERHWYGHQCEECVIAHHNRIEAWRKGGKDEELDRMFSLRQPPN